jgi:hypothetical protein
VQRPDTWGQTFNVAASEAPPWSVLWPQLAALYGLPVAVPDQPLSVGRMMRADPAAAARLRALGYDLGGFTPIDFIDLAMVCDWDQVLSMRKAQDLGFDANADILRPIAGEQVRLRAALAAAAPACSRGQLA